MKVCIAEKPSVAGEIAKILGANQRKDGYYEGNGYQITWTFGHLCTLKEPKDYNEKLKYWDIYTLPILPSEFGIKLIGDKGVQKQFEVIKRLVNNCEEVINCGDAGQEGELIQRWVLEHAGCKAPLKRLWISSLTEEAIKDGFAKLYDNKEFDLLYEAGKSRAIGDWILGINATRLFTLKFGKNKQTLSIGRVQTPTLAMIVNRHLEIETFVPEPYWEIKTIYRNTKFSYEKGKFSTVEEAKKVMEGIKEDELEITGVSIKEGKELPPNLFDLTSLQVEANKRHGYTAEQTLNLIQNLYEKKLVTYPRVDTVFLPNDQYAKIPKILNGLKGYESLVEPLRGKKIRKSKKVFNDNKVTDHHAIIPTGVAANNIVGPEKDIYDLITKRFIAAFYPDCKVSNTTISASVAKFKFKATGKQILEDGWRVVYQGISTKNEEDDGNSDDDNKDVMPHFDKGEKGPHRPTLEEKKTSPPKHFTEATLLRGMETAGKQIDDEELKGFLKENGIGRPSTRANIIETLFRRKYIQKKKKNILPTPIGIALINKITNPTLKSAELTGQWEKKLREIENGDFDAKVFIDEMNEMVRDLVDEVVIGKVKPKKVEYKCPKCKKGNIIKGKSALGCSEWKNGCDLQIPFSLGETKFNKKNFIDLITSGKTEISNTIYFFNNSFNIEKKEKVDDYGDCPKCKKGKIKKGSSAFGCSNYKECDVRIDLDQEEYIEEVLIEMLSNES